MGKGKRLFSCFMAYTMMLSVLTGFTPHHDVSISQDFGKKTETKRSVSDYISKTTGTEAGKKEPGKLFLVDPKSVAGSNSTSVMLKSGEIETPSGKIHEVKTNETATSDGFGIVIGEGYKIEINEKPATQLAFEKYGNFGKNVETSYDRGTGGMSLMSYWQVSERVPVYGRKYFSGTQLPSVGHATQGSGMRDLSGTGAPDRKFTGVINGGDANALYSGYKQVLGDMKNSTLRTTVKIPAEVKKAMLDGKDVYILVGATAAPAGIQTGGGGSANYGVAKGRVYVDNKLGLITVDHNPNAAFGLHSPEVYDGPLVSSLYYTDFPSNPITIGQYMTESGSWSPSGAVDGMGTKLPFSEYWLDIHNARYGNGAGEVGRVSLVKNPNNPYAAVSYQSTSVGYKKEFRKWNIANGVTEDMYYWSGNRLGSGSMSSHPEILRLGGNGVNNPENGLLFERGGDIGYHVESEVNIKYYIADPTPKSDLKLVLPLDLSSTTVGTPIGAQLDVIQKAKSTARDGVVFYADNASYTGKVELDYKGIKIPTWKRELDKIIKAQTIPVKDVQETISVNGAIDAGIAKIGLYGFSGLTSDVGVATKPLDWVGGPHRVLVKPSKKLDIIIKPLNNVINNKITADNDMMVTFNNIYVGGNMEELKSIFKHCNSADGVTLQFKFSERGTYNGKDINLKDSPYEYVGNALPGVSFDDKVERHPSNSNMNIHTVTIKGPGTQIEKMIGVLDSGKVGIPVKMRAKNLRDTPVNGGKVQLHLNILRNDDVPVAKTILKYPVEAIGTSPEGIIEAVIIAEAPANDVIGNYEASDMAIRFTGNVTIEPERGYELNEFKNVANKVSAENEKGTKILVNAKMAAESEKVVANIRAKQSQGYTNVTITGTSSWDSSVVTNYVLETGKGNVNLSVGGNSLSSSMNTEQLLSLLETTKVSNIKASSDKFRNVSLAPTANPTKDTPQTLTTGGLTWSNMKITLSGGGLTPVEIGCSDGNFGSGTWNNTVKAKPQDTFKAHIVKNRSDIVPADPKGSTIKIAAEIPFNFSETSEGLKHPKYYTYPENAIKDDTTIPAELWQMKFRITRTVSGGSYNNESITADYQIPGWIFPKVALNKDAFGLIPVQMLREMVNTRGVYQTIFDESTREMIIKPGEVVTVTYTVDGDVIVPDPENPGKTLTLPIEPAVCRNVFTGIAEERFQYKSEPREYAEIKQGTPGKESFEAMAGVPSTDVLHLSSGGSEFVVEVESQYVQQATTERKYTAAWQGLHEDVNGENNQDEIGRSAENARHKEINEEGTGIKLNIHTGDGIKKTPIKGNTTDTSANKLTTSDQDNKAKYYSNTNFVGVEKGFKWRRQDDYRDNTSNHVNAGPNNIVQLNNGSADPKEQVLPFHRPYIWRYKTNQTVDGEIGEVWIVEDADIVTVETAVNEGKWFWTDPPKNYRENIIQGNKPSSDQYLPTATKASPTFNVNQAKSYPAHNTGYKDISTLIKGTAGNNPPTNHPERILLGWKWPGGPYLHDNNRVYSGTSSSSVSDEDVTLWVKDGTIGETGMGFNEPGENNKQASSGAPKAKKYQWVKKQSGSGTLASDKSDGRPDILGPYYPWEHTTQPITLYKSQWQGETKTSTSGDASATATVPSETHNWDTSPASADSKEQSKKCGGHTSGEPPTTSYHETTAVATQKQLGESQTWYELEELDEVSAQITEYKECKDTTDLFDISGQSVSQPSHDSYSAGALKPQKAQWYQARSAQMERTWSWFRPELPKHFACNQGYARDYCNVAEALPAPILMKSGTPINFVNLDGKFNQYQQFTDNSVRFGNNAYGDSATSTPYKAIQWYNGDWPDNDRFTDTSGKVQDGSYRPYGHYTFINHKGNPLDDRFRVTDYLGNKELACSTFSDGYVESWIQRETYDYMKINGVKIYEIDNGQIEKDRNGDWLNTILEGSPTDVIKAEIIQGDPTLYANIAKNNSSLDGRKVHSLYTNLHDDVIIPAKDLINNGIVDNSHQNLFPSGLELGNEVERNYVNEVLKPKLNTTTVVSDFIVLQTTGGDQVVLYFEKDMPTMITGKTYCNVGDELIQQSSPSIMWFNNPSAIVNWDEKDGVHVGGYNGMFMEPNNKYSKAGNTVFNTIFQGKGAINEPGLGKFGSHRTGIRTPIRIQKLDLQIEPTTPNGEKPTGIVKNFYKVDDEARRMFDYAGNKTYGDGDVDVEDRIDFEWAAGVGFKEAVYGDTNTKYDDKVNDLIIHTPVSTQFALVQSLPKELDQRTNTSLEGAVNNVILDTITVTVPGKIPDMGYTWRWPVGNKVDNGLPSDENRYGHDNTQGTIAYWVEAGKNQTPDNPPVQYQRRFIFPDTGEEIPVGYRGIDGTTYNKVSWFPYEGTPKTPTLNMRQWEYILTVDGVENDRGFIGNKFIGEPPSPRPQTLVGDLLRITAGQRYTGKTYKWMYEDGTESDGGVVLEGIDNNIQAGKKLESRLEWRWSDGNNPNNGWWYENKTNPTHPAKPGSYLLDNQQSLKGWNFKNSLDGWTAHNGAKIKQSTNDLIIDVVGANPSISTSGINIDSARVSNIIVRMKSDVRNLPKKDGDSVKSNTAVLDVTTSSGKYSYRFDLAWGKQGYINYVMSRDKFSGIAGTITGINLHLPNATNETYNIDFIDITGDFVPGGDITFAPDTLLYTGKPQKYVVPEDGTYILETWGASGGGNKPHSNIGSEGGAGGYTKGKATLKKGEILNVYVGGQGRLSNALLTGGGWNGGGHGGPGGYGGGGASDIRKGGTSLDSRILIAGGGGGSDNLHTAVYRGADDGSGGHGGGWPSSTNALKEGKEEHGMGASNEYGYAKGIGENASANTDTGGGGGGYYGGKSTNYGNGGGGGGTGWWKSSVVTSASSLRGNQAIPKISGTGTMTGNYGNGAVRITKDGDKGTGGSAGGGSTGGESIDSEITAWNFNNTLDNFRSGTSTISQSTNRLIVSINNADSYFYSPGISIQASNIDKIEIKLQNLTSNTQNQIYFTTDRSGSFNEQHIIHFNTKANTTGIDTYTISTKDIANWNGNITSFRFDLSNGSGRGSVEVDSIRLISSGVHGSGQSKNFDYTGGVQTFTAPVAGEYQLEVWGAEGGTSGAGGKGGYSKGNVTLTEGETISVYVGGQTGYNGGGSGHGRDTDSGGGGTDIRKGGASLSNRIIVAGGGGGYGGRASVVGGSGGGTTGGAGMDKCGTRGYGGTQASGGNGGSNNGSNGVIGQGGSNLAGSNSGGGGGGGGYYGGGAGGNDYSRYNDLDDSSGGGGSGYIGGVTGGNMLNGVDSLPNTSGAGNISGKSGNGYARVKLIGEIASGPTVSTSEDFSIKTFTAPIDGNYTIEAWGAQGQNSGSNLGGKGAYGKGTLYLRAGQKIAMSFGGQGGVNGGGLGSGNGGGATTVYTGFARNYTMNDNYHPRAGTVKDGDSYVSNAVGEGVYGPYQAIKAGTYVVQVFGDNLHLGEPVAYYNGGANRLQEKRIRKTKSFAEYYITAPTDISNMEWCWHQTQPGTMRIDKVTVADYAGRILHIGGGGGASTNGSGGPGVVTGGSTNEYAGADGNKITLPGQNYGRWQHPSSGCTFAGEIHQTNSKSQCSQCSHSCGSLVDWVDTPGGTMKSGGGGGGNSGGAAGGINSSVAYGGQGGSSMTSGVTAIKQIDGNATMPEPYSDSTMVGNEGNGKVRINVPSSQEGFVDGSGGIWVTPIPTLQGNKWMTPFKEYVGTWEVTSHIKELQQVPALVEINKEVVYTAVETEVPLKGINPAQIHGVPNEMIQVPNDTTAVDPGTGTIVSGGTFLVLDAPFKIYYPNLGDFQGNNAHGIGFLTPMRGLGYVDQMDTTKWTREKWITLEFDVISRRVCDVDVEWKTNTGTITKNIPMTFEEGKEPSASYEKLYKAGEPICVDVNSTWLDFYIPLEQDEKSATVVDFNSVAINSLIEMGRDGDVPRNLERFEELAARHNAIKLQKMDLIGRIGNLILSDTGDPRWSNYFKNTDGGWMVPNLIPSVNAGNQKNILGDQIDIRGLVANDSTNYLDTWGSIPVLDRKPKEFGLMPQDNNISVFRGDGVALGYSWLGEITSMGNYDKVEVVPMYYFIDTTDKTNTPIEVDIYSLQSGRYIPINKYGDKYGGGTLGGSEPLALELDLMSQVGRRNISSVELNKAIDAYNRRKTTSGSKVYPLSASKVNIGSTQLVVLDGQTMTYVGSSETYGFDKNPGDRIDEIDYTANAQRWQYSIGLPTSAVAVPKDVEATPYTVLNKENGYIILALDIKSAGEVWNMSYIRPEYAKYRQGDTLIRHSDPIMMDINGTDFNINEIPLNYAIFGLYDSMRTAKDEFKTTGDR